jgi:hypothetical protein
MKKKGFQLFTEEEVKQFMNEESEWEKTEWVWEPEPNIDFVNPQYTEEQKAEILEQNRLAWLKMEKGICCEKCDARKEFLEFTPTKVGIFVSYYRVKCTKCGHEFDGRYIDEI